MDRQQFTCCSCSPAYGDTRSSPVPPRYYGSGHHQSRVVEARRAIPIIFFAELLAIAHVWIPALAHAGDLQRSRKLYDAEHLTEAFIASEQRAAVHSHTPVTLSRPRAEPTKPNSCAKRSALLVPHPLLSPRSRGAMSRAANPVIARRRLPASCQSRFRTGVVFELHRAARTELNASP